MTTTELSARVTVDTAVATAALAALTAALWGGPAGAGLAAAGLLTLANFRWLARGAVAAAGRGPGGRGLAWALAAGGRFAGLLAGFGLLLGSELVHPVGVVAGAGILPCCLVARGLRAARPGAER